MPQKLTVKFVKQLTFSDKENNLLHHILRLIPLENFTDSGAGMLNLYVRNIIGGDVIQYYPSAPDFGVYLLGTDSEFIRLDKLPFSFQAAIAKQVLDMYNIVVEEDDTKTYYSNGIELDYVYEP